MTIQESYEKSVSFCGRLSLDEQGRFTSGDIEEHIKWLAASMYGGEWRHLLSAATAIHDGNPPAGADTVSLNKAVCTQMLTEVSTLRLREPCSR